MDTYCKYIVTVIINNQERTEESTKHHFIAVFSMIVIAYLISFASKAIPELQKFIKRRQLYHIYLCLTQNQIVIDLEIELLKKLD
ncbi:MAG: hypothetical protein EZS28_012127 [Streblomastix strix]|uniref:Uncharacterized protein n=1 Tax=Streblomastix strix TaxID=222440 RepID=A0A5J4WBL8_9EUKA|nr:MAG: hypothetical protein EZS28_012127 [Streblomastix strix]